MIKKPYKNTFLYMVLLNSRLRENDINKPSNDTYKPASDKEKIST
ncbi:hypothetical protein RAMDARK_0817 [Rickettsia amblyommatis str. Darkwater]|uniref:Uncharacterized protein n=1 Tax=Rickettsia amblyommatis str. Ac/Pa TaxID=1359164 RepID=A0A0F3N228_RICAM|nr:hypothetical protein APHACPA_1135 [Rickettsia amblyommatis str. Ac/Pa]KJV94873.1 hypothetical protein RAMDARK_0817 [Rickettsia amblyommatis str. Darkwater]